MPDGHIIGEHYQIASLIGQGGMGDVYRGVDIQTQTVVAIKELKPEIVHKDGETVQRFEREAEALRKLNHPNIVKVLASFQEHDHHYIVMEYVSGGALNDLLHKTPQLPVERVLDIALDLSDALTRAHRLKIVHRDIKPANVLLREDGSPLLTDFGVARIGNTTRMTAAGTVVGTLAYLPPEALLGEPADERLDIWAFGVMLYEMLAGIHPFQGDTAASVLTNIMTQPVPDLFKYRSDVPWTLMGLVYWMLEKDPAARPASVRLIGAMLENIMSGTVITVDWFENKASADGEFQPNREDAIRAVMEYTTSAFRLEAGKPPTPTPTPVDPFDLGLMPPPQPPAPPAPPAGTPTGVVKAAMPTGSTFTVQVSLPARRLPRWLPWAFAAGLALLAILLLVVQPKPVQAPTETLVVPTQAIVIDPVAPDQHMTLIAQFEHVGGDERDVSRFIADNLRRTIEEDTPYSDIRIRSYPEVIRDADTARRVAEQYGAEVIVWGQYDSDSVTAQIQLGNTSKYAYLRFDHAEFEKLLNVQVTMTSERRESLAYDIIAMYNGLGSMNGNMFHVGRNLLVLKALTDPPARVDGNGIAARFHRFIQHYIDDPSTSIAEIGEAIRLDANNPMLYLARALAYQRLGDMENARVDLSTAERFAGKDWPPVLILHVTDTFFTESDYAQAYQYLDELVKQQPNDWYPVAFRGIVHYMLGHYAEAGKDIRAAITLNPEINFPYTFAMAIGLRQGDLVGVQALFREVLEKFPDPTLAQSMLLVTLSEKAGKSPLVPMSSAFGNVTLRRWQDVLIDTQTAVDTEMPYADPYFLRGIAYCNLQEYDKAEASYTKALEIDDSFSLIYLLRAEVRQKQNNLLGATSDLTTALSRPELKQLSQSLTPEAMGQMNCASFFDTDLAAQSATAEATPEATP